MPKKKKSKSDLEDMLVFSSEEELEEWLKEKGLTLDDFKALGGEVERTNASELEDLLEDLIEESLSDSDEANVQYLTEEEYEVFNGLSEEEKEPYLHQIKKGLS